MRSHVPICAHSQRGRRFLEIVSLLLFAPAAASAQSFSFEPPVYPAAPGGLPINGVDGWYQPAVGNTGPGMLYTYAGNVAGLSPLAGGEQQFEGGIPGGGLSIRAQRDVNFSAGGIWEVEFDFAARWIGPANPTDFLGSWSLQDSQSTRGFQITFGWGSLVIGPTPNAANYAGTGAKFHLAIGHYTAAGPTSMQHWTPAQSWRDLVSNNWYHARVRWDFDSATILGCWLQDVTGSGPLIATDISAGGWHLRGGPGSTLPLPTGLRLFGGSNGTMLAIDNLQISQVAPCYADCNGDSSNTVADFGCFQARFVLADLYADCNHNGQLSVADFGCFQGAYAIGCP